MTEGKESESLATPLLLYSKSERQQEVKEFNPNDTSSSTQHTSFNVKELHDLRHVKEKNLHEKFYFMENHSETCICDKECKVEIIMSTGTKQSKDVTVRLEFNCIHEKLWRMRVLVPNEYNTHRGEFEFSDQMEVWAVDYNLLNDSIRRSKDDNKLRLLRTEIKSDELEEIVFTPSSISLNRKRDTGTAEFMELVVVNDKKNSKCSFYFRNEDGHEFQKNWEFGWRIRNLDTHEEKCVDDKDQSTAFQFDIDESHIGAYAMGEKSGPLKRDGREWIMWNTDAFHYTKDTDPLYQSCPFVIFASPSLVGKPFFHGLFVDNTGYQRWDIGMSDPEKVCIELDSQPICSYIFSGKSVQEVLQVYTCQLTGKSPLPPLWAMGYHQCRWSYDTADKVKQITTGFSDRQIPCDCIYLDIDYMDGYRCFTWDFNKFPDPRGLVRDFMKRGNHMRTTCIIDPGIRIDKDYDVYSTGLDGNHFCVTADAVDSVSIEDRLFSGQVWPGLCAFPNFLHASTREWWGQLYKDMYNNIEVAGFWNDMNESALFNTENRTFPDSVLFSSDIKETISHRHMHNIYGMEMVRATNEGLQALKPNERSFVLTRSGFSGVQRYAWSWSGDNTSSWESMSSGLSMLLNMSLSGQAGCGADIGGFFETCTPDLYSRWIQMACLHPFCRTHTAIGTPDQEPWSFGEETTRVAKAFIRFRYQLMPYLYTQFQQASHHGTTFLKTLFYEYPNVQQCYQPEFEETEFMVGDSILVAPMLEQGKTSRKVFLPPGSDWYELDFSQAIGDDGSFHLHVLMDNSTVHHGNQVITVNAPITQIPIFIKSGSVIPVRSPVDFSQVRSVYDLFTCPMDYLIFPDKEKRDSNGILYMDDGLTTNNLNQNGWGLFQLRSPDHFKGMDIGRVEIKLMEGSADFHPITGRNGIPMDQKSVHRKYFE
jgi:alpha-glucosidase